MHISNFEITVSCRYSNNSCETFCWMIWKSLRALAIINFLVNRLDCFLFNFFFSSFFNCCSLPKYSDLGSITWQLYYWGAFLQVHFSLLMEHSSCLFSVLWLVNTIQITVSDLPYNVNSRLLSPVVPGFLSALRTLSLLRS